MKLMIVVLDLSSSSDEETTLKDLAMVLRRHGARTSGRVKGKPRKVVDVVAESVRVA